MQQVVLLGLGEAFLVKRTTQEIFVERSLITVWDEDGGIWWWKSGATWRPGAQMGTRNTHLLVRPKHTGSALLPQSSSATRS